jgi:hypothetical protein
MVTIWRSWTLHGILLYQELLTILITKNRKQRNRIRVRVRIKLDMGLLD